MERQEEVHAHTDWKNRQPKMNKFKINKLALETTLGLFSSILALGCYIRHPCRCNALVLVLHEHAVDVKVGRFKLVLGKGSRQLLQGTRGQQGQHLITTLAPLPLRHSVSR